MDGREKGEEETRVFQLISEAGDDAKLEFFLEIITGYVQQGAT